MQTIVMLILMQANGFGTGYVPVGPFDSVERCDQAIEKLGPVVSDRNAECIVLSAADPAHPEKTQL